MRKIIGTATVAGLVLSGGVLVSASADASPAPVRLQFTARTLHEHGYGKTGYLATESDKQHGKLLGYDAVQAKFDPATKTVDIHVALAIKGGTMLVDFNDVPEDQNPFFGTIVAGSGKFAGVTGTVRARDIGNTGNTRVTLTYTLP
jgi:hypothetical protein